MARNRDDQNRFLQILSEVPLIAPACKKAGISRATIYRWMKSNPDFRASVEEAQKSGRRNLEDAAESTILTLIREKNFSAAKYYLEHNSDRYKPMRAAYPPPPISKEDLEICRKAMNWIKDHRRTPKELVEERMQGMKRAGLIDNNGRTTEKFEKYHRAAFDKVWDKYYGSSDEKV